jgi:predicted N-acyltransferase
VSAAAVAVRLVHGVEQLPEAAWRELVLDRPALRLEVLRAANAEAPLQFLLLEQDGVLVAAAVCELFAAHAARNPFDHLLFGRVAQTLRRLGVSTRPLLLCRTPVGRQAPVALRTAPLPEQRRWLEALLQRMEAEASTLRAALGFVGVSDEDEPLLSVLRARAYLESSLDPTTRMDIHWTDFDSYLKYLGERSKNTARAARKERNRNRRNGVSIRRVPATAADADELDAFARAHFRHKNRSNPSYSPELLARLATGLGDDFLLYEAVRDGRRVGMMGAVRSGEVGWLGWIGIEQHERPNDFTYISMAFYEPADWAPALGLKSLIYGTAAVETKTKRGCRVIPSHIFFRPRTPLARLPAALYFLLHRLWYRQKSKSARG